MRGAGLFLSALLTLAVSVAPEAEAVGSAPSSPAFLTVDLPRSADLTSYHWCAGLGCQQPVPVRPATPGSVYRAISRVVPVDGTSVIGVDAYRFGALATAQAVRRLQAAGPAPGDTTVVAAVLLATPTRPNGGAVARLAPALATPGSNFAAFSEDPVIPPGPVATSFVDVGREYDATTDFPAWINVFAIVNAAAGALLLGDYGGTVTWTVGGSTHTAPTTWPVALPAASGPVYAYAVDPQTGDRTDVRYPEPVGVAVVPEPGGANQTVYYTVYTETLPLLMPLQAPFDAINAATGTHLQNPLVQALQPALTILVNLGYTDVDQDSGYSRTLMEPGQTVPFRALPGDEFDDIDWRRVPRDVAAALVSGVVDAVVNPFNVFGTGAAPAVEVHDVAPNDQALASEPVMGETGDTGESAPSATGRPAPARRTDQLDLAVDTGDAVGSHDPVGSGDAVGTEDALVFQDAALDGTDRYGDTDLDDTDLGDGDLDADTTAEDADTTAEDADNEPTRSRTVPRNTDSARPGPGSARTTGNPESGAAVTPTPAGEDGIE